MEFLTYFKHNIETLIELELRNPAFNLTLFLKVKALC